MGEMATNTPSSPFNPYNQLDFLTPAQEEQLMDFYFFNVENGILPNLRITRCGDTVFWTEIRKVRVYARNFLKFIYRYLSDDRVLYHIKNKEDAQTQFSVLDNNLFQITKLIQFVWITIFQSTPLESVVAPRDLILQQRRVLSRVLFADPLASSYFWQAGLLMCTMGELLKNPEIDLDDVPEPEVATIFLNNYSNGLLRLGAAILTRDAKNVFINVQNDQYKLDEEIAEVLAETYNENDVLPDTVLLNEFREAVINELENDENFSITMSGIYFYQPPLPTRFQVVYFQASCFFDMIQRLCNTLSVGFDWLFQGLTICVFGLFLYNLKLCNMVIGENFCREFYEYSLLNSVGAVDDPLYKHFHPTDPDFDWMEDSEGFFDNLSGLYDGIEAFIERYIMSVRTTDYQFSQQHSASRLKVMAYRYLNRLLLALSNPAAFAVLHRNQFSLSINTAALCLKDQVYNRLLGDDSTAYFVGDPAPPVLQIPSTKLGNYRSRFSSGSDHIDELLRYPMENSESSTIFDNGTIMQDPFGVI